MDDTRVVIDGVKNNWEDSFRGQIAIDFLEKSCREEVDAHVVWESEGQVIGYFGYGIFNFVPIDRNCYFSPNMAAFAVENAEEGWVIASHDYLAELMALDGYYPLVEAGRHYYFRGYN